MIPKNLLDEINRWINEKKHGFIQINFYDGRIPNININESKKISAIVHFSAQSLDQESVENN